MSYHLQNSFFTEPTGTSYLFANNTSSLENDLVKLDVKKCRLVADFEPNFQGLSSNLKIEKYQTTFLNLDLENVELASNFEFDCICQQIQASDLGNTNIAQNFVVSSFGHSLADNKPKTDKIDKIERFFDDFSNVPNWQPNLHLYIVQSKSSGWVGFFALFLLPGGEVQLQAVAGKATCLDLSPMPKLPILFNFAIQQAKKLGGKSLALSSSQPKLVQKYTDLGCKAVASRQCWILSKN